MRTPGSIVTVERSRFRSGAFFCGVGMGLFLYGDGEAEGRGDDSVRRVRFTTIQLISFNEICSKIVSLHPVWSQFVGSPTVDKRTDEANGSTSKWTEQNSSRIQHSAGIPFWQAIDLPDRV